MKYRILFITAVFFVACDKKSDTPPTVKSLTKNNTQVLAHTYAVPDSFKVGIGKVYEGYLNVQQALAADDFPKAKDAFSSMHGILHMLPEDGLDSLAKSGWDSSSSKFMTVLHPMASSKDIAEMRFYLKGYSLLLIDAIEKFGMQGTQGAYLFHCPMADSGKGADWLQKDKIKANPYQGKAMLDCGDLVREIKP